VVGAIGQEHDRVAGHAEPQTCQGGEMTVTFSGSQVVDEFDLSAAAGMN
jgi:hypothetical protein